MAKTVKDLQREYAKITEENRKAYDALHGTGAQGGAQEIYLRKKKVAETGSGSFKAQAQKDLPELQRKFEAAQAAYKKTQDAKNALKKELEVAQAAEKKIGRAHV